MCSCMIGDGFLVHHRIGYRRRGWHLWSSKSPRGRDSGFEFRAREEVVEKGGLRIGWLRYSSRVDFCRRWRCRWSLRLG